MRRFLPVIALGLAASGCGSSNPVMPLPASELRSVPVSATADGKDLVLTPYLWRDFMPAAPPDGQPLVAVLRIGPSDGSAVPPTIRADAAWVVFGEQVWAAPVREDRFASPDPVYYEAVIRNGPKWGPGVTVDVVVRLRDSAGRAVLLRAANQAISRTD